LPNSFDISERIARSDDYQAITHELQIGDAGMRVRAQAANLQQHVGRADDLLAIVDDLGAGVGVGIAVEAGCEARLGFDLNAEAAFDQRGNAGGTSATRRSPG